MHIGDDGEGQFAEDDVLELDSEIEDDAPDPDNDDEGDDDAPAEAFVGFADDGEDEEEAPPLVKKLRDQIRERDRRIAKLSRNTAPAAIHDDPEPVVPPEPTEDDAGWDIENYQRAYREREKALVEHTAWQNRQAERERAGRRAQEEQARQLEQQRRALGVGDYETKAAKVREALSETQLAVLVEAADNPARLIYALGGSDTRLDILAGQDKLAKFAAMVGTMEKEVKVSKRTPPAPESRVRGATAPVAAGSSDKKLAALEAMAEKSGDRSELIRYKMSLKQRAA